MDRARPEKLQQLLQNNPAVWRAGDREQAAATGTPTGYSDLDAALPARGWPRDALVEVTARRWGVGELQLFLPAMRAASRERRWLVWVAPPLLPYAPALAAAGVELDRIIVIRSDSCSQDALWSMEKALRTPSCALVLAWLNWLPDAVLRRLQLAAEGGRTLGVLFREREVRHSPAALRLGLEPGPEGLRVQVRKARGTFRYRSVDLDLH